MKKNKKFTKKQKNHKKTLKSQKITKNKCPYNLTFNKK